MIPCDIENKADSAQYHQVRDDTEQGLKKGAILKVSADGEQELPPGETPQPSRSDSEEYFPTKHQQKAGGNAHFSAEEAGHDHKKTNGPLGNKWRTAMDPGSSQARKPQARWSSFRNDRQESAGPSERRRRSVSQSETVREDGEDEREEETAQPEAQQGTHKGWSVLRSRVLPGRQSTGTGPTPGVGKVTAFAATSVASVPITTELLAAQLPVMILKTWLDRDEHGNRAVPVLLGNLRFRVGDSVGLTAGGLSGKEMFKLECEYGDGAVKWVSENAESQ